MPKVITSLSDLPDSWDANNKIQLRWVHESPRWKSRRDMFTWQWHTRTPKLEKIVLYLRCIENQRRQVLVALLDTASSDVEYHTTWMSEIAEKIGDEPFVQHLKQDGNQSAVCIIMLLLGRLIEDTTKFRDESLQSVADLVSHHT